MVLDSEIAQASSSGNGGLSKRAFISSNRHSSADPIRLVSSSGSGSNYPAIKQNSPNQPAVESRSSSLSRTAVARTSRDENPVRSFELLSISADKRK